MRIWMWSIVLGVGLAGIGGGAHAIELRVPEQHASIQAAIDAASPGDEIHIAAGRYRENLELRADLALIGEGSDRTVIEPAIPSYPVLLLKQVSGARLSSLHFLAETNLGSAEGEATEGKVENEEDKSEVTDVVEVLGGTLRLEHCILEGGTGNGLAVSEGCVLEARGCQFLRNGKYGLASAEEGTRITVADCEANENVFSGIYMRDGVRGEISGTTLRANEYGGMWIVGRDTVAAVKDCHAEGNDAMGIALSDTREVRVEGCVLQGNGFAGLSADESDTQTQIVNNLCEANKQFGIAIKGGASPHVEGNRLLNQDYAGICVREVDTAPEILRNHCEGNRFAGILVQQGARPSLKENTVLKNSADGIVIVGLDTDALLTKNVSHENGSSGIWLDEYAHANLAENTITANLAYGLLISYHATAEMGQNTLSENAKGDQHQADRVHAYVDLDTDELGWCFNTGRYARIERILDHYRKNYERYANSRLVYDSLLTGIVFDEGEVIDDDADFKTHLVAWQAAFPESTAPKLLPALRHYVAAREKDDSYEDDETQAEDVISAKRDDEVAGGYVLASNALTRASIDGASEDPVYYKLRLLLLIRQDREDGEIESLFNTAVQKFPDYAPFYAIRASQINPYADYGPERIAMLLLDIPKRVSPEAAPLIYADCLSELISSNYPEVTFEKFYSLDYPYAKAAIQRLLQECPQSDGLRDCYAFLASAYEDREAAREAFLKIGDDFDPSIWMDARNYYRFYYWATADAPYPTELVDGGPDESEVGAQRSLQLLMRSIANGNISTPFYVAFTALILVSLSASMILVFKILRANR